MRYYKGYKFQLKFSGIIPNLKFSNKQRTLIEKV